MSGRMTIRGGETDPAAIVDDWRLLWTEPGHDGSTRRVFINSQGYIKSEGFTPRETLDALTQVCRAYRDGDIKQNPDMRCILQLPHSLHAQLTMELGYDPLHDPEWIEWAVRQPELQPFVCIPANYARGLKMRAE